MFPVVPAGAVAAVVVVVVAAAGVSWVEVTDLCALTHLRFLFKKKRQDP